MSGLGRPFRPAALLVALALFHLLAWDSFADANRRLSWNGEPLGDLVAVYYPMGLAVLEGATEPVQGFYYPPLAAFLLAPLALLAPQAAAWTWLALELAGLGLALLLPLRWARSAGERDLYLAAALFSFPFLHDLHWGQISTWLFVLVLGGLVLCERGRERSGGALIGLAGALKLYPVLFLLPLLLRGERRAALAGAAIFLAGTLLLPFAIWGLASTLGYHGEIWSGLAAARESLWRDAAAVQHVPSVLARWAAGEPAGAPSTVWWVLGLLSFGLVGVLRVRMESAEARAGSAEARDEQRLVDATLLWLALPLVLHPSWPHYFVYLPLACLVALRRGSSLALVLAAASLSSIPLFRALDDPVLHGRLGLLVAADLLLLVAVLGTRRDGRVETAA